MALNKDLPVLAAPTFFEGPYRISFLLLMVSAFNLGASPSMTNTSLIPIDVKKEIRKNRFLQQSKVISCRISEAWFLQMLYFYSSAYLRNNLSFLSTFYEPFIYIPGFWLKLFYYELAIALQNSQENNT